MEGDAVDGENKKKHLQVLDSLEMELAVVCSIGGKI